VEELEDRLPDQMEPILSRVRASLRDPPALAAAVNSGEDIHVEPAGDEEETWEAGKVALVDEDMFDDTGEGVGVEGDLDREED
jgi:hypothetical protein